MISKEREEQAIPLEDFMPVKEAADGMGVSRHRVHQVIKELGWPTKPKGGRTLVSSRVVLVWEPKKAGRPRRVAAPSRG